MQMTSNSAVATSRFDRFFQLTARGSSARVEVLGGVTTFVAMAYIIVVNPAILKFADLPVEPSSVATVLAAAFGCLLMGLYANRPIAVAPYMGENAFIAFGLAAMGIGWQQRLGAVFVAGVVFLLLTVLRLRERLVGAISTSMKHALCVGIGLFLAFIGLYETGIIASGAPAVPVKIGHLQEGRVLLAVGGFVVMAVLMHLRVRGALLIGMAVTAVAGYAAGLGKIPDAVCAVPFTGAYDLSPIALKLDIPGVLKLSFLPVLLTLVLMSLLDTLGTLVGVGAAANMLDEKGNFPDIKRPMLVDAVSCIFSAAVGTSTSGAFIESATGIREGARTGLAAIVTGVLFLASLFFLPLLRPLQELTYVYGPALIAVGALMLRQVVKIDFDDLTEAVPAFATIAMMVFTYNIANGLTAGLVLHPLLKLLTGKVREITLGGAILGAMCLTYFICGMPH